MERVFNVYTDTVKWDVLDWASFLQYASKVEGTKYKGVLRVDLENGIITTDGAHFIEHLINSYSSFITFRESVTIKDFIEVLKLGNSWWFDFDSPDFDENKLEKSISEPFKNICAWDATLYHVSVKYAVVPDIRAITSEGLFKSGKIIVPIVQKQNTLNVSYLERYAFYMNPREEGFIDATLVRGDLPPETFSTKEQAIKFWRGNDSDKSSKD